MTTESELTPKDIKTLKYEMRAGFVFGGFLLVPGLAYLIIQHSTNNESYPLIDLAIVALPVLIFYLVNRKLIRDLKLKKKTVTNVRIQKKENQKSWEAGSGVVGRRAWDMRETAKFNLIIENTRYEVERSVWEAVNDGDYIEKHVAESSGTILEFKPCRGGYL